MKKEQRLNILFLTSWFPTKENPTLGNFVENHAKAISLFHNVNIIYAVKEPQLSSKYLLDEKVEDHLKISLMYFKSVNTGISFIDTLINTLRHSKAYLKLYSNLEHKPDLVHANVVWPIGLLALWLKFRNGIKYVLTEHWTIYLPTNRTKVKKRIFRIINQGASKIMPVSLHLQEMMIESGMKGNFEVVPNTIDTSIFNYAAKKKGESFKFVHISTMVDHHKNIKGLLRAYKQLLNSDDNNFLLIISDGEIGLMMAYAERIGIPKDRIKFQGTLPAIEIAKALQKADANVQFSNYETFGIVPAESLCCGTPVISTRVGFLYDYEQEQIGYYVEIGNEQELLEKMRAIKSLNFNHIHASQKFSKEFSSVKIANSISNIYKTILNL